MSLPAAGATVADPSASFFKQGCGRIDGPSATYTHPLINNATFNFPASPRKAKYLLLPNKSNGKRILTSPKHTSSVLTVPDTTFALRADFRVLRHYNNAAGSMAEVRDETTQWRRLDSVNGKRRNAI